MLEQLEEAKGRRDTSPSREAFELVLQRLCEFCLFLMKFTSGRNYKKIRNGVAKIDRIEANRFSRLKQAAADPSALSQETIIDNLDAVERGRLARIRNIGIAVSSSWSNKGIN